MKAKGGRKREAMIGGISIIILNTDHSKKKS